MSASFCFWMANEIVWGLIFFNEVLCLLVSIWASVVLIQHNKLIIKSILLYTLEILFSDLFEEEKQKRKIVLWDTADSDIHVECFMRQVRIDHLLLQFCLECLELFYYLSLLKTFLDVCMLFKEWKHFIFACIMV